MRTTFLLPTLFLAAVTTATADGPFAGIPTLSPSDSWSVTVGGEPLTVYRTTKNTNHGTNDIHSMSFAGFDLPADGSPVVVSVKNLRGAKDINVRPHCAAGAIADTASFTLTDPQHLVFQNGTSYDDTLVLSANPHHTPPAPEDVTHHFAAGHHDLGGHFEVGSGETVYLAEGAVVEGAFSIVDASDVKIFGRGIVHGGNTPHQENYRVVRGDRTSNVTVDGITFSNSPGWIISFWGGNSNLTVNNIKTVGQFRYNTDGVQTGTTGLTVENCFLQCNDDNFSLNGICKDVRVRHNVLWNLYNGGVFMLGWATGQHFDLQRLDISDNTVVRAGGCCDYDPKAPVSMKLFGSNRTAKDIYFRNLTIEDIAPYGRWIDLQAGKASDSVVSDITFENITVLKTWKVAGEVHGMSPDNPARNIAFRNVTIEGTPMTRPDLGGLNLINTSRVTVEGDVFADEIVTRILPNEADPNAAHIAANNNGGNPTQNAAPASPAFSDAGTNLLTNPGLDDTVSPWTPYNGERCKLVYADGAVTVTARKNSATGIQQDITAVLREQGPGNYTWAAAVRAVDTPTMVKATLVLEDDNGLQQHPAPDTEAGTGTWHTTARTTPINWTGELKRALLIVQSGYAHTHDITIDRAWLSR